MTLYVKKIWSLNPNKYKYITLDDAIKQHNKYVLDCMKAGETFFKPLNIWLRTEI